MKDTKQLKKDHVSRVTAIHQGGPKVNGIDGCFTRWMDGFCCGRREAEWLNSLGPDNDRFGHGIKKADGGYLTNFEVRSNWVRTSGHLVWEDQAESRMIDKESTYKNELAAVQKQLAQLRKDREKQANVKPKKQKKLAAKPPLKIPSVGTTESPTV